jgi:hypothetical protein
MICKICKKEMISQDIAAYKSLCESCYVDGIPFQGRSADEYRKKVIGKSCIGWIKPSDKKGK